MEKALIASDAVSGLLVACALVMPSKKLKDVKPETVIKKFKDKDFEIFFKIIKENEIEHLITLYGDMDFPKALIIKL